ncbi:hypothetical protein HUK80_15435 [Flavobacterium sp. MAH-1]|uniref:Lipoprotein n=1 Tax=Flavobacterium agri TaxID=2743471 RepID=A0A7Y8Y4K3_9FLAO|nr:hypothetical protein [Flavobacterium agri]NUY82297.1 hypothetical protein [Flavobacterium agri]NYA72321.1 hypothetical protein [Flavobacterium agri]
MKKITLLLAFLALYSCAVKQTKEMLSSGDYDSAIDNAVYGLRNNKDKKGNQDYIYILEEAFAKAKERDLRDIDLMMKDASPRNLEAIFNTYVQLNNRQEKIRPLLPLKKLAQNEEAKFEFGDYKDQIVSSKNALSKYLYDNTKALLATKDKMSYRRAYDDLNYLNQISPNFKDVPDLIKVAKEKGSDYVNVYTKNETNVVIPKRLESDLLDFSTYGLNDQWTVYHSNKQPNFKYDFGVIVNFRQINVSPEQIREREFVKEKEIKVGRRKKMRGRYPVLDSLGKPVYEDVYKIVRCKVREFTQFKSAQVAAKVDYIDFGNNQLLQTFPLASEFVFQNVYATYKGDKRAVGNDYLPLFNQRPLPFPSNEQMVFDTGEDLKAKLKNVITRNKIRS